MGGRLINVTMGAVAAAAVGGAAKTAVTVTRRRKNLAQRPADDTPFGSLRGEARTVIASDGVPLHVEVDEPESTKSSPITMVFVHGFALNMDCWYFQRQAFRGLVRSVYFDQRGHGRSGSLPADSDASIEQLGDDLRHVLDAVVPDGPVVLVGHSMGGMTIAAFAELYPDLLAPRSAGGRIVGTALISTTAGGLDPAKVILPVFPGKLRGGVAHTTVRTLARGHRAVDRVRRVGHGLATVATDALAFGDDVPESYVDFVDSMLSATPFHVVASFFPRFALLDKFDAVEGLGQVPTTIIIGTDDRIVSVGHARKLHARIPGSRLIECDGAGHMVILERHGPVNAGLDQLLAAATSA